MLGKTANGIFWMFRSLERSENVARMLEAGFRIALTRSISANEEWESILWASGNYDAFTAEHDGFATADVIDFMLRDRENPSSVISIVEQARTNARLVRTALTREVWESTNDTWLNLRQTLAEPVTERRLPAVLDEIRSQSRQVRGALHGTMLRNDIYSFARLGTFIERADNTARMLDVKYYTLLPSVAAVGTEVDNVQWEMLLRSLSALTSYRWLHGNEVSAGSIADFLMLDRRMPRSLAFCYGTIVENLTALSEAYALRMPCHTVAEATWRMLSSTSIDAIFAEGLHEFTEQFIQRNAGLANQIETDFRFHPDPAP